MPDKGQNVSTMAMILLVALLSTTAGIKLSREQAADLSSGLAGDSAQTKALNALLSNLSADHCAGQVEDVFAKSVPAGSTEVKFIIATVPDPMDSRLDYTYDRNLDGIQRGLGPSRYTLDRFWLPWTHDAAHAQREEPACRSRTPGILVFRS